MANKAQGSAPKKASRSPRQKTAEACDNNSSSTRNSKSSKNAGQPQASVSKAAERDREQFIKGVLARGEAAKPDAQGELPPGATHEIVGEDAEGQPEIKRRRFSLF